MLAKKDAEMFFINVLLDNGVECTFETLRQKFYTYFIIEEEIEEVAGEISRYEVAYALLKKIQDGLPGGTAKVDPDELEVYRNLVDEGESKGIDPEVLAAELEVYKTYIETGEKLLVDLATTRKWLKAGLTLLIDEDDVSDLVEAYNAEDDEEDEEDTEDAEADTEADVLTDLWPSDKELEQETEQPRGEIPPVVLEKDSLVTEQSTLTGIELTSNPE